MYVYLRGSNGGSQITHFDADFVARLCACIHFVVEWIESEIT